MRESPTISRLGLALSFVAVSLIAGCGTAEATDYTEQLSDNFFAACTEALEDPILQARLCQCIFDEVQNSIVYEEFSKTDETLVLNPAAQLPPEVNQIIAGCVIDEADL